MVLQGSILVSTLIKVYIKQCRYARDNLALYIMIFLHLRMTQLLLFLGGTVQKLNNKL